MPVIVLGSGGGLIFDPDFDDGGIVQDANTMLDNNIGIVDTPTVIDASVATSVGLGSSTFYDDDIITTIPGSVITNAGGFFTDVVQTIPAIPTPNIVATSTPTPSTPDGGPTVGDFDDDGVVQVASTTIEPSAGGFVTNDPIHDVVAVTSTIQAGSGTFTQGTITSGTTPAPDAGTIVVGNNDSFIPNVGTTTIPGHVVS